MLYQLRNFEQSLSDFERLLAENDRNARAHYYKGKILRKQALENEAVLHFEQVIKNTTGEVKDAEDEELAGNALFEIAKIRIG